MSIFKEWLNQRENYDMSRGPWPPQGQVEKNVDVEMGNGIRLPSGKLVTVTTDIQWVPPYWKSGKRISDEAPSGGELIDVLPKVFDEEDRDLYQNLKPEDKKFVYDYVYRFAEKWVNNKSQETEPTAYDDTIG